MRVLPTTKCGDAEVRSAVFEQKVAAYVSDRTRVWQWLPGVVSWGIVLHLACTSTKTHPPPR